MGLILKNLLISSFVLMALLFSGAKIVYSQSTDPCSGISGSSFCEEKKTTENTIFGPNGIGTRISQVLTVVAGLVSVISAILGGIQYITSSGDPQKVNRAKNTIIYASVGVVVALLAQAVVLFILSNL